MRRFFFNVPAADEVYTLSLHDALPIYGVGGRRGSAAGDNGRRLGTAVLGELGEGFMRARQEGLVIGVGEKWADLKGRLRKRRKPARLREGVISDRALTGPAEVDGNGIA